MLIAHLPLVAALLLSAGESAEIGIEAECQAAEDRRLLQSVGIPTDGPGLVAFFRRQDLTAAEEQHFKAVMARLADRTFKVRERASDELIARGPALLPLLRHGLKNPDLETQRRIERCVRRLELLASDRVIVAAVHCLTDLKEVSLAGGCAALLAYLPRVDKPEVQEELVDALFALTARTGQLDPTVAPALRDPSRVRRGAAALLLGRFGNAEQRAAVREVARSDLYLSVRLRAAQGLLAVGDAEAVPALLAILSEGSPDLAQQAEELLRQTAGKGAPAVSLTQDSRRKCGDTWEAWWRARQDNPHLKKVESGVLAANVTGRSRDAANRFINATFQADLPRLRATTGLPFVIPDKNLQTLAELDMFLQELCKARPEKVSLTLGRVMRPEEYADKLRSAEERGFLHLFSRPGVRVVEVRVRRDGYGEMVVLIFVRVLGIRAHIIGLTSA